MGLKEVLQDEYKIWLLHNVKEGSRKKYLSAVQIISRDMRALSVIDKDLFDVTSFGDFRSLYNKIIKNNSFITKNQTGHHMYSSALRKHYAEFLANKFCCDNDIELDSNALTLKKEIIASIEALGGFGTIKDIFSKITERENLEFSNSKNPEKTISNFLVNNSKTSKNLFYNFENGDGQICWGLAYMQEKEEYQADIPLSTLTKLQKLKYENITEGERKKIQSYVYERNSKARSLCINHYGAICQVCGCDIAKIYGKEFKGKIHVHHKIPLKEIGQTYEVDPIRDLIPVCPNCHMILHCKNDGYYTIEEVKAMLKKQKK